MLVERILDTSLRVALTTAALGSVIMVAVMLLNLFVPMRWNWYTALAFFGATTCLAGARLLHSLVPSASEARNDLRQS